MTVNEEDGVIKFHVANRAATHLGRKLYSTTPPALAELIANSYDAYATEVHVTIDKDIDHIIVADDGIGMTLDSLNKKYALVGREKTAEPIPKGFTRRNPMGQKGIGKLASFSLGDEYDVYTKTVDDERWRRFSVKYAEFIGDESEYPVHSELCELPDNLEQYASFGHGFITVIHELRRGVNQQTIDSLVTRLSRRFYIKSGSSRFDLYLNDQRVDLSRNAYYGSMDYATYVGFNTDEIQELLGDAAEGIELVAYDSSTIKDEGIRTLWIRLSRRRGSRVGSERSSSRSSLRPMVATTLISLSTSMARLLMRMS